MDTAVSQIQKFMSIFILIQYGYKLDVKSMDIKTYISQMIAFYNYRIKDINKWMINQVNSMLM